MKNRVSTSASMFCLMAMIAIGLACWAGPAPSAKGQQRDLSNPRHFAAAYLAALARNDWQRAAAMCRPDSKQAKNAHRLGDTCVFSESRIGTVYSDGKRAIAITHGLKQNGGKTWQLAFIVDKKGDSWVLDDIDWVPSGKEKAELEKYLGAHPTARSVDEDPEGQQETAVDPRTSAH